MMSFGLLLLIINIYLVLQIYYKTKGISLTSSFGFALLIQVIIPVFIVINLDQVGNITLDKKVLLRMTNVYTLYLLIVFFFLLGTLRLHNYFKLNINRAFSSDSYFIRDKYVVFFFLLAVAELLILFFDGNIQFVFSKGLSSLNSGGYSDLRVDLIEQGNVNYKSSIFNYVKILAASGTSFSYILFLYTANFNAFFFKKYLWLTTFLGTIVFLIAFSTFEKGPIALFVLITLLVRYSSKLKEVSRFKLIVGILSINICITLLISFTTGYTFQESFIFLYYRIFVEPTASAYMHFAVFPDDINWVKFSNFNFIKNLFDLPTVLSTGSISIDVAESFTGLYYSQNSNLVANGWAQLGYYGVIIYTSIAYILFGLLDYFTFKYSRNCSVGILKYFYLLWFIYFANTSLENFIISSGCVLWPLILIYSTRKNTK